jgi:hypothetical protein
MDDPSNESDEYFLSLFFFPEIEIYEVIAG